MNKETKRNIIFSAVILIIAAALAVIFYANRSAGARAVVTVAGSDTVLTYPLNKDETVHIGEAEGAALDVTLEIKDSTIRFINSRCPDHLCEGFGALSHEGDTAVCMPAGVMVSVSE